MYSSLGHFPDCFGAVCELVEMDSHFVQQRKMQVCHRCQVCVFDVTSTFQRSGTTAGYKGRQIRVSVCVWIPHTAAEHDDRVVEERSFAVASGAKLPQVRRKQRYVIGIYLCKLRQLSRIVSMV